MNPHRESNGNGQNENTHVRRIRLLVEFVVRLMIPKHLREEFLGDLLEEWSSYIVPRCGKLKAFAWLCSQLLRSIIPMASVRLRGHFFGGYAMLQRQNIPKSVKMAAAANLLFAAFHLFSFVYFVSTMPIQPPRQEKSWLKLSLRVASR